METDFQQEAAEKLVFWFLCGFWPSKIWCRRFLVSVVGSCVLDGSLPRVFSSPGNILANPWIG